VERTERRSNANATNNKIASGVAGRNMMTASQSAPTLRESRRNQCYRGREDKKL
jgi:hypothetical protein